MTKTHVVAAHEADPRALEAESVKKADPFMTFHSSSATAL